MKKFTVYKAIIPSHGWMANMMMKLFPGMMVERIECDNRYLDMEGCINCIDADSDSKKRFPLGFYMGDTQNFGVKDDQKLFEDAVKEEEERMAIQTMAMMPGEPGAEYG